MKKVFALAALGLVLPSLIFAQSCEWVCSDPDANPVIAGSYGSKVRISELLPNPEGDDTESEFIELENIYKEDVPLQGWRMEDESGRSFVFTDEVIKKGKFFVIERSVSRISLNNTGGDEIVLISPDDAIQNTVAYEGTAKEAWSYAYDGVSWGWTMTPTPDKKNSIDIPNDPPLLDVEIPKDVYANHDTVFSAEASEDPDSDPITAIWQWSDDVRLEGLSVTRKFSSSGELEVKVTVSDDHNHKTFDHFPFSVHPFDLAEHLVINEVYGKPADGEQEFIEIKNAEGRTVELGGWELTDGTRKYVFPDDAKISDGGIMVVMRDVSSIALNDTGDSVTLVRPDDSNADAMTYPSATKGKSYSRYDMYWEWANPTPGTENELRMDTGSVFGATAIASDGPNDIDENDVQISESFSKQFGIYIVFGLTTGIVGYGLYKKWKKDKQQDEEFDLP